MLSADEAKQLIESIPTDTVIGLRDRAIIGTMLYTFARASAVCTLEVRDFFHQQRHDYFRLHEKGGKEHEVPAHRHLSDYVHAYLQTAGIGRPAEVSPLSLYSGKEWSFDWPRNATRRHLQNG